MDKRDSDGRPDEPAFDMDEEIDARNERLGRRAALPHPVYRPMHPSHAIILAALIVVGGLWGGKLLYDYVQEQRLKAAFVEADQAMRQALQHAEAQARQTQAEQQRQLVEHSARLATEQAHQAQEKRFASAQCQFWWQQDRQNPSERSAQKKAEACGN